MDSWKELTTLLRCQGGTASVCCDAIKDLVNESDLPDIFHDLITNFIPSLSSTTRLNTGKLILKLCDKFRHLLAPLISESFSDGHLLTLHDLDIASIAKNEHFCLFSRNSNTLKADTEHLYKKNWLKQQRDQLNFRLGLELSSEDAKNAVQFEQNEALITQSDLLAVNIIADDSLRSDKSSLANSLRIDKIETIHQMNADYDNDNLTSETWLARLVRHLVVGLLDPCWERRHGCCVGLDSILRGLYPSELSTTDKPVAFLMNDILCCCLCLLGLDRFVDFDSDLSTEGSDRSPVKETAGRLVAVVLGNMTGDGQLLDTLEQQVSTILLDMCAFSGHWSVRMGGLVGLRYVAVVILKSDSEKDCAVKIHSAAELVTVARSVLSCGHLEVDDLLVAASSLLTAVSTSVSTCSPIPSDSVDDAVGVLIAEVLAVVTTVGVVADQLCDSSDVHLALWHVVESCGLLLEWAATVSHSRERKSLIVAIASASNAVLLTTSILATLLSHFLGILRITCVSFGTRTLTALGAVFNRLRWLVDIECAEALGGSCAELICALLSSTSLASNGISMSPDMRIEGSVEFRALGKVMGEVWRRCGDLLSVTSEAGSDSTGRPPAVIKLLLRAVVCAELNFPPVSEPSPIASSTTTRKRKGAACITAIDLPRDVIVKSTDTDECRTFATRHLSDGVALGALHHKLCSRGLSVIHSVYQTALATQSGTAKDTGVSSHWRLSDADSRGNFVVLVCALVGFVADEEQVALLRHDLLKDITASVQSVVTNFLASRVAIKPLPPVVAKPRPRFEVVRDTGKQLQSPSTLMGDSSSAVPAVASGSPSALLNQQLMGLLLLSTHLIFGTSCFGTPHGVSLCRNDVLEMSQCVHSLRGHMSHRLLEDVWSLMHWLEALCDIDSIDALGDKLLHLLKTYRCEYQRQNCLETLAEVAALAIVREQRGGGFHMEGDAVSTLLDMLSSGDADRAVSVVVLRFLAEILQDNFLSMNHFRSILTPSATQKGKLSSAVHLLQSVVPHLSSVVLTKLVEEFHVVTQLLDALSEESLRGAVQTTLRILISSSNRLTSDAALRECANSFHQKMIQGASTCDRASLAVVFRGLTEQLEERVLPQFETWFGIALLGLGDFDSAVRVPATVAFRLLVPLAPLARDMSVKRALSGEGETAGHDDSALLTTQLFSKSSDQVLTASLQDVRIIQSLARDTNLLVDISPSALGLKGAGVDFPHQADRTPLLSGSGLRAYQWEGVMWLTQLRRCGVGGVLADEMGLGKSLQALTALAVLRVERNCTCTLPSLVVCPASLGLHWEQEVGKFFPGTLLRPHRYSKAFRDLSVLGGGDVLIVSYDALRSQLAAFQGILWEYIVLDEAHLIRNPRTATARAVFSLRSRHRMALSGTPVQNQVEELWSLLHFLVPDYLGDYSSFRKQSVLPILKAMNERQYLQDTERDIFRSVVSSAEEEDRNAERSKKDIKKADKVLAKFQEAVQLSAEGVALLRVLHKQVLPFILRRTKARVAAELPPKTIVDVMCPLSTEQRHLYATFQTNLRLSDDLLADELQALRDRKSSHTIPLANATGLCLDAVGFEDEDDEMLAAVGGGTARMHPLAALTYLKLLSVHPSLVIAAKHVSYRQRLLSAHDSSGKLTQLTRLLVDSGVVLRREFCPSTTDDLSYERLFETEADSGGADIIHDEGKDEEEVEEMDDEENDDSVSEDERGDDDNCVPKKRSRVNDTSHVKSKRIQKIVAPVARKVRQSAKVTVESDPSEMDAPPTHRCLLFAQHTTALDLVESQVLKRYFPSVRYERLDGGMAPAKRAATARRFNDQQHFAGGEMSNQPVDLRMALPSSATKRVACTSGAPTGDDVRILLMTKKACGLGLNLTAADTVIFLEHDWNPFVDLQAMDRAHRIGQTAPVTVYRLLAESTIEARIVGLQGLKQAVVHEIINDANTGGMSSTGHSVGEEKSSFGGMLWNSLAIYGQQLDSSSPSAPDEQGETEEDIDLQSFLRSVGQG